MTKAPTPAEMSKGQSDNTNNATKKFDYTAVADRLRTVSWKYKIAWYVHLIVFYYICISTSNYEKKGNATHEIDSHVKLYKLKLRIISNRYVYNKCTHFYKPFLIEIIRIKYTYVPSF